MFGEEQGDLFLTEGTAYTYFNELFVVWLETKQKNELYYGRRLIVFYMGRTLNDSFPELSSTLHGDWSYS